MVSSFQSSVSDNTATSQVVVTDPIEAAKKQEEAKKSKMKSEQENRAKSLFVKLQEQREVYNEVKLAYYKSKADNRHFKNQANMFETSAYLRGKRQERYEESTVAMNDARHTRDVELRRLETYTSNYCSAQTMAMHISIFTD